MTGVLHTARNNTVKVIVSIYIFSFFFVPRSCHLIRSLFAFHYCVYSFTLKMSQGNSLLITWQTHERLFLNAHLSSRKRCLFSYILIGTHKNMSLARLNIVHQRCIEFHLENTRPHLKRTTRNIGSSLQSNLLPS